MKGLVKATQVIVTDFWGDHLGLKAYQNLRLTLGLPQNDLEIVSVFNYVGK
jgi:hypothetical protein